MLDTQQSLDAFSTRVSDVRRRGEGTVGELGAGEPLWALRALAFRPRSARARRFALGVGRV